MQFSKNFLLAILDDHDDDLTEDELKLIEDTEVIRNKIYDTSRWSNQYEWVFRVGDKFYESHYSVGATESQDESAYEHDGDMIDVTEVVPVEQTIIKYVPKK